MVNQMNEKLNNIFVTVKVAKLAKEKGFNEWCAGILWNKDSEIIVPNFCQNFNNKDESDFIIFDFEDLTSYLLVPTHFQLIEWLRKKHSIFLETLIYEYWVVKTKYQTFFGESGEGMTINEALELALNQIQNGN